jgi:SpoVK/Ycf46/Vps4 family AAA+-type ATPase
VSGSELLDSLRAAVDAAPADTALRLHLAELLIQAGEHEEARHHLGHVLALDPRSERALELLTASGQPGPLQEPSAHDESVDDAIDWDQLDRDFDEVVQPMFVEGRPEDATTDAWEVTREPITLADVGGLAPVKERLELAFLAPLRNPELRRLYGKSLRGGLVLYGPPGCGKSFIARALAGELAAGFLSISITDVLNMYVGQSEANLHELFMQARRSAPCVLFFDEIDALGRRRAHLSSDAMRTTVNQLLLELDGVEHENEGVFVLAATNHPWDIDPALRRPGRFDRMLLVLPPDVDAREAIFRTHLRDRPVAGIDAGRLARKSDGYSGADIKHVCDSAAEKALVDSARTGDVRMIEMRDLEAALGEVHPSLAPWFETARNVVTFANSSGDYDDLREYMRRQRLL